MKFLSMLVFISLAIAAFVFMVSRPPVEGNAMNFGGPVIDSSSAISDQKQTETESAEETPEKNTLDKDTPNSEIPAE